MLVLLLPPTTSITIWRSETLLLPPTKTTIMGIIVAGMEQIGMMRTGKIKIFP
jgi:hypothetical protein